MSFPPTEIVERQRRITVAEYHRMIDAGILHEDEHVQLVDGFLVAMTPQSPPHALVIQELTRLLARTLGKEYAVRTQLPMTLGDESEPEPDVAVIRKDAASAHAHPHEALLVVEVASDSLSFDRGFKAQLYATHAIPEYWIVNLKDRRLEVRRDPDPGSGRYRTTFSAGPDETVSCAGLPGVTVDLADLLG